MGLRSLQNEIWFKAKYNRINGMECMDLSRLYLLIHCRLASKPRNQYRFRFACNVTFHWGWWWMYRHTLYCHWNRFAHKRNSKPKRNEEKNQLTHIVNRIVIQLLFRRVPIMTLAVESHVGDTFRSYHIPFCEQYVCVCVCLDRISMQRSNVYYFVLL